MNLLLVLCMGALGEAWLNQYFNLSGDTYEVYRKDVVKWLNYCVPEEGAEEWEESVRLRKMSVKLCGGNILMENCDYWAGTNGSSEYHKHLMKDARTLCMNVKTPREKKKQWISDTVLMLCVVPFIFLLIPGLFVFLTFVVHLYRINIVWNERRNS